ncbi:peroxiredoxin [Synechococcus phage S-SZBM1]|uniref:Peroxiredoxin n=1 Tax=Synechococcus phage S-SZBM1 TaxID=2926475 RepID=A0AC61TSN3_9CAUD|nr:peroxyredoxin antioxidant [Synechococcus phage S-SZBM1]UNH61228.1 peroxiredoxin [Synechococcus phage S-SZBM1]
MTRVPEVTFKTRSKCHNGDYDWKDLTTSEIFDNKRVVVFALPGAFTPTCSSFQLPGYEEKYDDFISLGIDDIYCLSVNDSFVMNAWFKQQDIKNVKPLPDGSGDFTFAMGMSVAKVNLGFGYRSWRYAMIVNDGEIEHLFEEPGKVGNCPVDPYEVSDPDTVLAYLRSYARKDA